MEQTKKFWESVDSDRIGSWHELNEETLAKQAAQDAEEKATADELATRDLFTFKPSEFQLIEELEYDETIQRPEAVRFYTLDEQVGDAYEKMIPRGRTTKFQMDVLQKEAERLRALYLDHIVPTAETYLIREGESRKTFSWIHPVYADYKDVEKSTYSFNQSWLPMFEQSRIRVPNFYRTMLTALPYPYKNVPADGVHFSMSEITEFVDSDGKNPNRALPTFYYPRTQRHEDGRFDILRVPMDKTADIVKFIGYYADRRPLPVPNPLPGHDFLSSSDAVMVEKTSPLSEIVPSVDAILTHAVPTTTDPYGEGMKYLRMYDVKLSDIPWKSWKSRFPEAELAVRKEPVAIDFPKSRGEKPSENLMKYYREYYPGLSSRQWLMDQADGGELVVQMLMSQVGENGTVGIRMGSDAEFDYPNTTLSECDLVGLKWDEFLPRGVLRRTWGAKDKITLQCIPLELLRQERAREGHKGRKQWMATTHAKILDDYVKAIVGSRPIEVKQPKEPKVSSAPVREVSQLRHEVIVLLNDKERLPEDKVRDITTLLENAILNGEIFVDSNGAFLVCLHTMAILLGDLSDDRRLFYDTWTARVDGFRVCKFCGEHVNSDVIVDQEDFTDDGRVIRHADALETRSFDNRGSIDHIKTLAQLKDLFVFTNPSDEVFFMLISLLHVVPEVDQLMPILVMGRKIAQQLAAAKMDPGVAGIAQMILMIQAHVPPLVPRRSFGSKPLTLRGYPRDAPTAAGYTIIDSMILVLSRTLEAYPTSFKGSSATTMRSVLSNPSKVKDLVTKTITTLMKGSEPLRTALERAKAVLPAEEPTKPSTMLPGDIGMPAKTAFGSVTSLATCPTTRVYWTNPRPPNIKQPEIVLEVGINHFASLKSANKIVEAAVSERVKPTEVSIKDKEVAARLKMGKDGVSEDWHTNALIATRLASVFQTPAPIRELESRQKPDDLRDITKGYVFELMKEINKDPLKKSKLNAMKKDDLALMMLTANVKEATEITNSLKAKERITYTERFRLMTDADREITKELVDRGLAPYIISTTDRILFAKELKEQEQENEEIGVGRTIDDDDFETTEDLVTRGQYGDHSGSNAASGNIAEIAEAQQNDFQEEDLGT